MPYLRLLLLLGWEGVVHGHLARLGVEVEGRRPVLEAAPALRQSLQQPPVRRHLAHVDLLLLPLRLLLRSLSLGGLRRRDWAGLSTAAATTGRPCGCGGGGHVGRRSPARFASALPSLFLLRLLDSGQLLLLLLLRVVVSKVAVLRPPPRLHLPPGAVTPPDPLQCARLGLDRLLLQPCLPRLLLLLHLLQAGPPQLLRPLAALVSPPGAL